MGLLCTVLYLSGVVLWAVFNLVVINKGSCGEVLGGEDYVVSVVNECWCLRVVLFSKLLVVMRMCDFYVVFECVGGKSIVRSPTSFMVIFLGGNYRIGNSIEVVVV